MPSRHLHPCSLCFVAVYRLDPSHARASFWHAAVCGELGEATTVPSAAPGDYVAKLFDGYADRSASPSPPVHSTESRRASVWRSCTLRDLVS